MYKCINGFSPSYLIDRIDYVSDHHTRNTRSTTNNMLHVPKPRLNQFKQSLQYKGPSLYNSLPNSIKDSNSLSVFKKNSKEHFRPVTI